MANKAIFNSPYVIDGVSKDMSPARLLGAEEQQCGLEAIVDESFDFCPGGAALDSSRIWDYLQQVKACPGGISLPYAGAQARCILARELISTLWKKGHFLLENLKIEVDWTWSDVGAGSLAALYQAAEQAADLADMLDLPVVARKFRIGSPKIAYKILCPGKEETVPHTFVDVADSWLIYLPFSTDDFHLGASALADALKLGGGVAPNMEDPDYFIDCYEVLRELVEDGIVLSGSDVYRGGLIAALDRMTQKGTGAVLDFTDLCAAYPQSDLVRILFAELPGAVLQIRDSDFDYVDAELLLQDVMYFPLGHVCDNGGKLEIHNSAKTAISAILDSLLR